MPKKTAIVLAAGLGTRMKTSELSPKPKVLHEAGGLSIIKRVVKNLHTAGVDEVRVVVGFGGDQVRAALSEYPFVKFYNQEKQLGTADAVKSADVNSISGDVMICNGDHPLITSGDFGDCFEYFNDLDLMVVSVVLPNPPAFGRIVRDAKGSLLKIVEEKDASSAEKKIREVNTGMYIVKAEVLKKYLPLIQNNNSKKEFYLTDILSLTIDDGKKVQAMKAKKIRVSFGVNDKWELAKASKKLYFRKAKELAESGVELVDPTCTYIDSDVVIGKGSIVGPGCMIKGKTVIGENVIIEGHCQINDSRIKNFAHLKWGSLVDNSIIGEKAIVGPYARLRPESEVGQEAHIGNFVELKKTKMGARAKANHLAYLGDSEIGEGSNIGCGTITCNYAADKKKYKTILGKNVFVGSDVQFVAPITIGDDVVIGAGSTITKDVPDKALAVTRAKQMIRENYKKD